MLGLKLTILATLHVSGFQFHTKAAFLQMDQVSNGGEYMEHHADHLGKMHFFIIFIPILPTNKFKTFFSSFISEVKFSNNM